MKNTKEIRKSIVVLVVICLLTSAALAVVNHFTAPVSKANAEARAEQARLDAVPDAASFQLVEIVLKRYVPALHKSLGVYLPLITTNCGVLGVTMNVISDGMNYSEALLTALGCGLGFFLAMVLFSGVRSRVAEAEPPKSFEGLPITLVSAAIVSLSFFGLTGIIDRLFG